jgi:hypothetical protein
MSAILKHYPFLQEIPEEILAAIDLEVLYVPIGYEFTLLCQLAMEIQKNIIVYNKFHQPKTGHLCKHIKFAALNPMQLSLVRSFENRLDSDKVVVAYERPLKLG